MLFALTAFGGLGLIVVTLVVWAALRRARRELEREAPAAPPPSGAES